MLDSHLDHFPNFLVGLQLFGHDNRGVDSALATHFRYRSTRSTLTHFRILSLNLKVVFLEDGV